MTLEPTKVSELLALLENADRDATIQFCMAGNESLKFEVWERYNAQFNGGPSRRGQLAYLLRIREEYMTECKLCGHIRADHSKLIRNEKNKLQSVPECPRCDCVRFV
jgi:hypothetical protein